MTNSWVKCSRCGEVMKTYGDLSPAAFKAYIAQGKWDYPIKKGIFRHKHGNEWVIADYEWHDTPGAKQIF